MESMLKHDGMQHTITRHKRELADTPEVNTRDRMHLATTIQEHSYRLETLEAYIQKVHKSLYDEATVLGILLNNIPATLDFLRWANLRTLAESCLTWTTTNYIHNTTIEHILAHRSTISCPANHNLFLDKDSSSLTLNLIYTRNSELFHETIFPNTIVYKHIFFTIAQLDELHYLVLLLFPVSREQHRCAGDSNTKTSSRPDCL